MLVAGVKSLASSEVSSVGVATDETVSLGGAFAAPRLTRVVLLPVTDSVTDGAGEELLLARRDALVRRLGTLLATARRLTEVGSEGSTHSHFTYQVSVWRHHWKVGHEASCNFFAIRNYNNPKGNAVPMPAFWRARIWLALLARAAQCI